MEDVDPEHIRFLGASRSGGGNSALRPQPRYVTKSCVYEVTWLE